jgi:hypothetical protein
MKHRTQAWLAAIVAACCLGATMVGASQSPQYLPTTGVFNGLTAANTINSAFDALNTCNSGSAAPTNALGGAPKEGQCWLDTTSSTLKVLKIYTGSAWVVRGVLDVTNGIWVPPVGGGSNSLASAATTDLCSVPQSFLTITGNTNISAFGTSCVVGQRKKLVFSPSGTIVLTHNATSLIIPGAQSITVASGDVAEVVYLGSGNWRVTGYVLASRPVKASPVGADYVLIQDSAASNAEKKATLSSLRVSAAPTRQIFTSGSGTYTTPANVVYLKVTMVGGGGGGGGSGTSGAGTGGTGGSTTFSTFTAAGGTGGTGGSTTSNSGGAGGAATGCAVGLTGVTGGGASSSPNFGPGKGGDSASFAGGGLPIGATGAASGAAGITNTGGGGSGGQLTPGSGASASGGGGGASCIGWINSPSATYSYAVGAAGTAGVAGTGGSTGGAGGSGLIIVEEFYQ